MVKAFTAAFALLAAGVAVAAPASAEPMGTATTFACPKVETVTARDVAGRDLALEKCWWPSRQVWTYRANVRHGVVDGDVLRTGITPHEEKGWIPRSYRVAPQDISSTGDMPNEWIMAGDDAEL